jgi:hypothetical protein
MPQFIRHTPLPLRTRNPWPHAIHGLGAIQIKIDPSKMTEAQLNKLRAQSTTPQSCAVWLGEWANNQCQDPAISACAKANGFWNASTLQCLATPPPTGISAVPTWAWLLGGAVAAGAAWYAFGR